MIDEISSYHQYQQLQQMKSSLTTRGFRFCSILLSWLECDHYQRHWDGLHEKWVGCKTFKLFMESSPPAGLGLGDEAKEEIEILKRGGVPGAERILAAWYADQPLPKHGGERISQAVEQAINSPLLIHGEGKPKHQGNNVTLSNIRGNDTTYTLRRLARDAPEILSKVQSGELTVNQAAIQSGIRKKPTPEETIVKAFAKATGRLQVAKAIISSLNHDEAAALLAWLSTEVAP
jgi:hypothetical protein